MLQGKEHDPCGNYVRHWLLELERVPDRYIQYPWMMPVPLKKEVGCVVGRDYPRPIVDHRQAREETLSA